MLRGGSWNNNARNARAAYRYRYLSVYVYGTVGFRLVCAAQTQRPGR